MLRTATLAAALIVAVSQCNIGSASAAAPAGVHRAGKAWLPSAARPRLAKRPRRAHRHRVWARAHQRPRQARPAAIRPVPVLANADTLAGLGGWLESPAPSIGEVDAYLCAVYERLPVKRDSTGDFTWKDGAAAARLGLSVCEYVVGGMHPELRAALFGFGQAADRRGLRWSFLSGFRDDYRQKIASGFKARTCGSMHGGSCRTRGYGDGRAADLWTAEGEPGLLFALVDRLGRGFGLSRPMPGHDPAHVQLATSETVVARARGSHRYAQAVSRKHRIVSTRFHRKRLASR